jgi:serine O-acetyltransferase
MREDVRAIFAKDPAARSLVEVLLCYPGLHAVWFHRFAHALHRAGFKLLARILANLSRWLTGVDIHPGAEIAPGVFIDHGSGVVIGETAVVGSGSLLYQGAVLGGTSKEKKKRHPALGKNVEVGAGAIILGPLRIGDGARIGAGSVVIRDVPAGATVIGVPGRVSLGFSAQDLESLQHNRLPDPVADAIKVIVRAQGSLEERLAKLESVEGISAAVDRAWEEKKSEIMEEFFPECEEFREGEGI